MEKNYFKKGSHVILHGEFWDPESYKNNGSGWIKTHKHATVSCNMRDEYGRFTKDADDAVTILLKVDGKIIEAEMRNVEPDVAPPSLSFEELEKLWGEIRPGSIYYADYRNSLGVYERTAYDYVEGYEEENYYDLKENFPNLSDKELEEKHWETLSAEGFAIYCQGCEHIY